MENYLVKDLMVPLSEYATVPEGSTLYEAVQALEKSGELLDRVNRLFSCLNDAETDSELQAISLEV